MPTLTAFVVSHTHWDREWYQPFQEFRIRLVAMVDRLLDLLDADPDFRYFMLDGQAIVLDDYLAVRPEQRGELARHVASGRLLVGPWFILPDEFLVGPESLVRNLLVGRAASRCLGAPMPVGYIPDAFGHISQLPQVLNGFGLDIAAVWRGLPDLPTFFAWRSPDGSEVTAANLREGYGDLAWAPSDPDGFSGAVRSAVARLAPHAEAPLVLLMDGSDHLEARPDLPALLEVANWRLSPEGIRLVHATLPQYFSAVAKARPLLTVAAGEFRGSRRSNILPGVLSARMWVKQRNRKVETLLATWAEPFSAIAGAVAPDGTGLSPAAADGLLGEAWRLLLQNQTHDSICGCSVDQVHEEMVTRYDQAEQIAEELTGRCLKAISARVDTDPRDEPAVPVLIFNPTGSPATGAVHVQAQIPPDWAGFDVIDASGNPIPSAESGSETVSFSTLGIDAMDVVTRLATENAERVAGQNVLILSWRKRAGELHIDALLGSHGGTDLAGVARAAAEIRGILATEPETKPVWRIRAVPRKTIAIAAPEIPPLGYATVFIRPSASAIRAGELICQADGIDNEYLAVSVNDDGALTVLDKRSGLRFAGINRFVDDGDSGDEYNFSPVPGASAASCPRPGFCSRYRHEGDVSQTLEMSATYDLPVGLAAGRRRRAGRTTPVTIRTRATLLRGVSRVDFETTVDNTVTDHRLRVAFPYPAAAETWRTETPWDVVERPVSPPHIETDPAYDAWQERPVAQQPQYRFCDISADGVGLMLANRGLPEVEARRDVDGRVSIYLTLLRCVGWLSRDDLPVRKGHGGPGLPVPGAQCAGRHTFHYSMIPHGGDWLAAMPLALSFAAPPRALVAGVHGGTLPARHSFVSVEPPAVTVSAMKRSEDGRSIVLRLWNAANEDITAAVRFTSALAEARLARLDETPVDRLSVGVGGLLSVPVRRRQAVTVLLKPVGWTP